MLALTKPLELGDYQDEELIPHLKTVDGHFEPDKQHEHRRWEYAMALLAISRWERDTWYQDNDVTTRVADVGGAGSTFTKMLGNRQSYVIDPELSDKAGAVTVEEFATRYAGDESFHVVVSISTLEHTDHPLSFLEACHALLRPGGLLFLTFDYTGDNEGDILPEDRYHFHWMRKRIFNFQRVHRMLMALETFYGFTVWGPSRLVQVDPQVYDYTFAALCLRKPDAGEEP